ncbi:hypothetical protein LPJ75_003786, partial [Coemansia sp. RSA 2598]
MSTLANDDSTSASARGSGSGSGSGSNSGASAAIGDTFTGSWGGGNFGTPLMQFTLPGEVHSDGSAREAIDVAVVSLARYTFADPARAVNGPAPLEPQIENVRLLGVDQPPLASVGVRRISSNVSGAYEDDGLVAEFTEDRCNRQLSQLARRLLLPDSYVEACYDFIQFMEVNLAMLDVESVQRNVFKCLKICARLSKLHGYSIHVMWQVVQQAYNHIRRFTAERAQAIDRWHVKLTNRIRMMAVVPAADGSAPPRLPTVPPRKLLEAQARERLLPLPEINVSALNDLRFDRAAGVSSAEYYMTHSLSRSRMPVETSLELAQGMPVVLESSAGEQSQVAMQRRLSAAASHSSATRRLRQPSIERAGHGDEDGDDDEVNVEVDVDVDEQEGQLAPARSMEGATNGGTPAVSDQSALLSTREAELAIIEHQLRELESMPAHSMGPMLRAALNLLVEMRFRLQLGLPRATIAQNSIGAADSASGEAEGSRSLAWAGTARAVSRIDSRNISSEAFGADANEENRVIEYLLNQISNSRRNSGMHAAAAGFGAPLYMMPHHMGMYSPSMRIGYNAESRQMSPEAGPHGTRRRRGGGGRRRSGTDVSESVASEEYGRLDDRGDYATDEEDDYDSGDDDGDDDDGDGYDGRGSDEEDDDEEDYLVDDDEAESDDGGDGNSRSNGLHDESRHGQQRSERHIHRRQR